MLHVGMRRGDEERRRQPCRVHSIALAQGSRFEAPQLRWNWGETVVSVEVASWEGKQRLDWRLYLHFSASMSLPGV